MRQTDRSFSAAADQAMSSSLPMQEKGLGSAEELRRRSRRSLFRAGLAAAPLILTLRNRAAWAQTGGNGTPVTPLSAAKAKGLSEEEIEQLRRQLQQAEQSQGFGHLEGDPAGF